MIRYRGEILDAMGAPMSGVLITVYDAGTLDLATLYDTDDTGDPKTNPFTNESNGFFAFYAPNGRYDLSPSKTGATFNADDFKDILISDTLATAAILSVQYGDNGTPASTTETTLKSFSIPAGTLGADGDTIRVRATLRTSANGNTKRVRLKFGATTILDSTALALNGNFIVINGTIIRTGAATQRALAEGVVSVNNPAWGSGSTAGGLGSATPAETLSGAVLLAVTGQNGTAAANDLICDSLIVELLRA